MKIRKLIKLTAFTLTLAAAGAVNADVLAYDPFDASASGDPTNGIYDDGQVLRISQNKDVTGGSIVGFGNHSWVDSISQTWFVPTQGSLQFGEIGANSTGAIQLQETDSLEGRWSTRQMNSSAPEQVLYMTGLIRTNILEENSSSEGSWMGFTDGNGAGFFDNTARGILVGQAGFGGVGSLVVKGGGTAIQIQSAAANTIYMIVAKITPNLLGNDLVEIFVNPGDTEPTIADATISDRDYITNMSDLDYLSLGTRADTSATVLMDELRLTTTWESAVGIPEANAYGLLAGFFALFAMAFRRKQR